MNKKKMFSFLCGEVWLAGIGFTLASAIETCEQEHSKISFCRQSKPSYTSIALVHNELELQFYVSCIEMFFKIV